MLYIFSNCHHHSFCSNCKRYFHKLCKQKTMPYFINKKFNNGKCRINTIVQHLMLSFNHACNNSCCTKISLVKMLQGLLYLKKKALVALAREGKSNVILRKIVPFLSSFFYGLKSPSSGSMSLTIIYVVPSLLKLLGWIILLLRN
jgi:hypothetical protein